MEISDLTPGQRVRSGAQTGTITTGPDGTRGFEFNGERFFWVEWDLRPADSHLDNTGRMTWKTHISEDFADTLEIA